MVFLVSTGNAFILANFVDKFGFTLNDGKRHDSK